MAFPAPNISSCIGIDVYNFKNDKSRILNGVGKIGSFGFAKRWLRVLGQNQMCQCAVGKRTLFFRAVGVF